MKFSLVHVPCQNGLKFGSQPSVLSSLLGYSQEKALVSPNCSLEVHDGSLHIRWRETFYKGM